MIGKFNNLLVKYTELNRSRLNMTIMGVCIFAWELVCLTHAEKGKLNLTSGGGTQIQHCKHGTTTRFSHTNASFMHSKAELVVSPPLFKRTPLL